jgi:hypothetical protein
MLGPGSDRTNWGLNLARPFYICLSKLARILERSNLIGVVRVVMFVVDLIGVVMFVVALIFFFSSSEIW